MPLMLSCAIGPLVLLRSSLARARSLARSLSRSLSLHTCAQELCLSRSLSLSLSSHLRVCARADAAVSCSLHTLDVWTLLRSLSSLSVYQSLYGVI